MKNSSKVLIISSVLMLASSIANADTCCIAGTYTGTAIDDRLSCPNREGETRNFTMVIEQAKCQKKITGQVRSDPGGKISNMEGEVFATGDSCTIAGKLTESSAPALSGPTAETRASATRTIRPAETTDFKGILNRRSASDPWVLKDGKYTNSGDDGCSKGEFSMIQQLRIRRP
jgi:hypothetical protein